jgi:hypothetical protein
MSTGDTLRENTSIANIGTIVAFSCPTGFALRGEPYIECRDDVKNMYYKAYIISIHLTMYFELSCLT